MGITARPLASAPTPPGGAASTQTPIRVMIVDDSAVVRGLVSRWIEGEPGLELVARHGNGQRAVEDVAKSRPDIIILDVEMPVMDGLTALPLLLKSHPGVKVIMASTLTSRNAEVSLKALSLGATDYIPKPESNSGVTTSETFRRDLVLKIKALGHAGRRPAGAGLGARAGRAAAPRAGAQPSAAAQARASRAGSLTPSDRAAPAASARQAASSPAGGAAGAGKLRPFSAIAPKILIIGSSTGGPQALAALIKDISPALGRLPVLITQHMPATFTAILAKHLGESSGRPSKEAEQGETPQPGHIYVAPGGFHMRLMSEGARQAIRLDQGPEINFCRPAVDPLFETVARIHRAATLGVILTGMGSDGANGTRAVAAAGGSIIAQDEATSVVWGMPGAAAAAGTCSAILPLGEIGGKLKSLIK